MVYVFTLLALVCEIIGTVGGFGSSVFFVPVAQFFYDFKIVLGLTAVLHVFSNLAKIIFFYEHINRRLFWLYGIPSIIMVILGAMLVTHINIQIAEYALSAFLILFSLFFFLNQKFQLKANNANAITGGSVAGFAAGLLGTGGAIRGASMAAFNLEKNVFVGTSAAIDMGVDLSRTVIYLDNVVFILLAVSFIGSYIGKLILNHIEQEMFRRIVLGLIFIIGIFTLVNTLR